MINKCKHPDVIVPDDLVDKWQELVNTMAELSGIPAGLIMRITNGDIEVFVASDNKENPYHPGDRELLVDSGLYCETVINTKQPLLVPDALSDLKWKDNPDVKLDMISYQGLPILFPDGTPFGTLCILDTKPNEYTETTIGLLNNFRDLIESHIALLYMNSVLGEKNKNLSDYIDEIEILRGIVPICSFCKKIRDDDGNWCEIEDFVSENSEAEFSHSFCPECGELHYGDTFHDP